MTQLLHILRGSVLVELGVSINLSGYYPANTNPSAIRHYLQANPVHWVRRRLKNAFTILHQVNQSGAIASQALALVPYIVSLNPKPDWCLVTGYSDITNITGFNDSESVFTTLTANFEAIIDALVNADIRPIVATLPPHGAWMQPNAKYATQHRYQAYLQNYCKKNNIPIINNYTVLARPDRQAIKTCTGLSRTANVVTATVVAHGYTTNDWFQQTGNVDAAFQLPANPTYNTAKILSTPTVDTFTYSHAGADGVAVNTGSVYRNDSLPDINTDGVVHWNAKGASKASLTMTPILSALFPRIDALSDNDGDYYNIAGSGVAATNNNKVCAGMMRGTGGTRSGVAVSHTGNVADGYTSNVSSGNPTSVTCSKVARTDPGYEAQEWQQIAIVAAGGADCEHQLAISQTLPATWAANTVKALSNFVKPTAQNGFFYVCVTAGTTDSVNEPAWPTKPGQLVSDNDIVWECRSGWKAGDTVVAMAEYKIEAMSDAAAIKCLSFGIVHSGDDTKSILDFAFQDESAGNEPLYQVNENGYFLTPEAAIDAASASLLITMRSRITAGKSATLRLSRVTWRKV